MQYAYVGVTPRNLASGRPLVFGDAVDASELTPADEALQAQLVEAEQPAPVTTPSITTPEAT